MSGIDASENIVPKDAGMTNENDTEEKRRHFAKWTGSDPLVCDLRTFRNESSQCRMI